MTDVILNLLFPFPLCVFALAVATILLALPRRRRQGTVLVAITTLVVLTCGTSPLPTFLVTRLEQAYPALLDGADFAAKTAGARYVVVLGGSGTENARLPVTSRLNRTPLVRAIEAARIHRLLPGSRIVTSGRGGEATSEAEMMSQLLVSIGVRRGDIVTEDHSSNTYEQAVAIRRLVGGATFVLVTSAVHMPRAFALFTRLGMQPIAAPTDHLVKHPLRWELAAVVPKLAYFQLFEFALYEHLAQIKDRAWGRI